MINIDKFSHKSSFKISKLILAWVVCLLLVLAVPFSFLPNVLPRAEAKDVVVSYDSSNISYITGDFTDYKVSSTESAYEFLDTLKDRFKFSSAKESLLFVRTISDIGGGKVYKFNQVYNGIRVDGGELSLSVDNKNVPISISGNYYLNVFFDNLVNFSQEDAIKELQDKYKGAEIEFSEKVYEATGQTATITYIFFVSGDSLYKAYVDAKTLESYSIGLNDAFSSTRKSAPPSNQDPYKEEGILQTDYLENEVSLPIDRYLDSDGTYIYFLADKDRNIYMTTGLNLKDNEFTKDKDYTYEYYYSKDGVFTDPIAVQGYEYLLKCYDFYADADNFGVSTLGLKNNKGQDVKLIGIVHYGKNYENAGYHLPYKDGVVGYFLFGDGNKDYGTNSFVLGLDVVGHEYTHAIASSIVDLDYLNAPGAISESIADIFGAVIEGNDITSPEFWTMGEDLTTDGDFFRDMSAPYLTGDTSSYNSLAPYCNKQGCDHTYCDNGNVHANSTLLTYATYLMYKQDTEFFTTYNILALWYKTLTKLSSKSDFIDFAKKMVLSAQELRYNEKQQFYITNAFSMVSIPGYYGEKIWNNNYLTYPEGEGTVASPYIIGSQRDLASMMYLVNNNVDDGIYNSARYTLAANVSLNDVAWTPIGTEEHPFNGTFNGGGYTITGLNLNNTEKNYNGLFGVTGNNSYIYNLNIDVGNTTSSAMYVGAIVGKHLGAIDSCTSALNITGKNVGGLVGYIENNAGGQVISNSYVTAGLTGDVVGGLVSRFSTTLDPENGCLNYGYISACYTTGTLVGKTLGSLVGEANGVIIINNISIATLICEDENGCVGGLVGKIQFRPLDTNEHVSGSLNYFINNFVATTMEKKLGSYGLIFGGIDALRSRADEGIILIDKCTAKIQGDIKAYNADGFVVKEVDLKLSSSEIYEGDFDFDNENFYLYDNFTSLENASAFDLTVTYAIGGTRQMPTLISSSFWLSYSDMSFDGGNGTKNSPYEIRTAYQLSLLANNLLDDSKYSKYASAYYKLTSDINLYGKIWAGIGYACYIMSEQNGTREIIGGQIRPFMGNFDGDGHVILNLTSVNAMSVVDVNRTQYLLYSYSPGLFGLTASPSNLSENKATISNLTIENPYVNGSVVGAVVSEALDDIKINKVAISGGKIISSSIAGGLVGRIGGLSTRDIPSRTIQTDITGCEVNSTISGRVVGGAVGSLYDTSVAQTKTNISKFLFRGSINVMGFSLEPEGEEDLVATAGSVVGNAMTSVLNILSCVSLGDLVAYERNCLLGGFVGAIKNSEQSFEAPTIVRLNIVGGKFAGKAYCILDDVSVRAGKLVGGIYNTSAASIIISADETTFVSIDNVAVFNNKTSFAINDNSKVSQSKMFEDGGDFDFYNSEYYDNEKYFQSDVWTTEDIDRFYFVVVIKDYDGSIIKVFENLKQGDKLPPIDEPSRAATSQYFFEFSGWSEDLTNVKRSMTVYAKYKSILRSYQVTYEDEDGNVIYTVVQDYGTNIDQRVKAPEKKGNFFMRYSFIRWGEEGQKVEGETIVKPVYKSHLTSAFTAMLWAIGAILILIIVSIWSRKRKFIR